jgi:hypothetical protein
MEPIADHLMGDVWPQATPGADGANYGTTTFSPQGHFEVRSHQSFVLSYTVGEFGLDDTGAIKIVHRWTHDGGKLQFDNPAGLNYVTAVASNGVQLELYAEPYPHQRPWYHGLRITVKRGYMSPGDRITVTFGDRSQGSPGYRLQTFCESAYEFRVLADVCATGVFIPISTHTIAIDAGPAHHWVLTAPTLRRVGETFSIGIRAEDEWGNATYQTPGSVRITASTAVEGLTENVTLDPISRGCRLDGLKVRTPGVIRFSIFDANNVLLATSNPLVVKESGPAAYWGDLHGQSGETVGINTIHEYMAFARDIAFLDVTSHQANDFQITNAFWQQINNLAAELNEDGRFVVFPGYEWSGNTPVGGDHNVFFAAEGRQIRRSSHSLLSDRSDIHTDANTLGQLFESLQDEDCVLFGHIGGRPADISVAEDARLRTAVEVHSDWGTFEWFMTDAFRLGYRVGLVCNSDGHKGAPGACYPGASEFGAYSGITCFIADDLSRPEIFRSLRQRRHYGTTGCRMHMEVTAHLGDKGSVYAIDPRIEKTEPMPSQTATLGDIASTAASEMELEVTLETHAPIERVIVLNGAQIVTEFRPFDVSSDSGRIRIIWEGAEYRGRGRTTYWNGSLSFDRALIRRFEKINLWNLDRKVDQTSENEIVFDAVTTGNFGGCDVWLDKIEGRLKITTSLADGEFDLFAIDAHDTVIDAGGLDRKIRIFRLPEEMNCQSVHQRFKISLNSGKDNPLWIKVVTEDGFVGWSSPIYII